MRAHDAVKRIREKIAEEQGAAALQPFRLAVGVRLVFADQTPDVIGLPAETVPAGAISAGF